MQSNPSCLRVSVLPFFILLGGAVLAAVAGCHRPPAPDVMATVNGKEILRSEVEKYYKANLGDNPQEPSRNRPILSGSTF